MFLFPNALLSPEQAEKLGADAVPKKLSELCSGSQVPVLTPLFDNEALSGSAYLQWLWMLLSGQNTLFPSAPYLWKGLGGGKISQQLWLLSPYRTASDGRLYDVKVSEDLDEICGIQDLLGSVVRQYGFQLQVQNSWFFLSRKDPWDVQIPIWEAQLGKIKAPPFGSNAEDWSKLSQELEDKLAGAEFNLHRKQLSSQSIDGFWINGGGDDKQLPFTTIRAVQANSPVIRGLCYACGIPKSAITDEHKPWPEAPEGDRISVFSEFLASDLKQDVKKWAETWDRVVDMVQNLIDSANKQEKINPVFIASDGNRISTMIKKNKSSLLSIFSSPTDYGRQWLAPEEK